MIFIINKIANRTQNKVKYLLENFFKSHKVYQLDTMPTKPHNMIFATIIPVDDGMYTRDTPIPIERTGAENQPIIAPQTNPNITCPVEAPI